MSWLQYEDRVNVVQSYHPKYVAVACVLFGNRLVICRRRHRNTVLFPLIKLVNGKGMMMPALALLVWPDHCHDKMCMCVEAIIVEMRLCEKEGL